MADQFGVDAAAVARTSTELSGIREYLSGLHDAFADGGGVTGSAKVQRALQAFVSDSSDARKKLDAELERAAGLLAGLAQGATTLDSSLAEADVPPRSRAHTRGAWQRRGGDMTAPATVVPGFTVRVPPSWFQIDVWRATRTADLARLVDQRITDDPRLHPWRAPLLRALREAAAQAERQGAVFCAAMTDPVEDDDILAAVLTVFHTEGSTDPAANTAERIAAQVTASADDGAGTWRRVDLPHRPRRRPRRPGCAAWSGRCSGTRASTTSSCVCRGTWRSARLWVAGQRHCSIGGT
jgi:hypothetical protein